MGQGPGGWGLGPGPGAWARGVVGPGLRRGPIDGWAGRPGGRPDKTATLRTPRGNMIGCTPPSSSPFVNANCCDGADTDVEIEGRAATGAVAAEAAAPAAERGPSVRRGGAVAPAAPVALAALALAAARSDRPVVATDGEAPGGAMMGSGEEACLAAWTTNIGGRGTGTFNTCGLGGPGNGISGCAQVADGVGGGGSGTIATPGATTRRGGPADFTAFGAAERREGTNEALPNVARLGAGPADPKASSSATLEPPMIDSLVPRERPWGSPPDTSPRPRSL